MTSTRSSTSVATGTGLRLASVAALDVLSSSLSDIDGVAHSVVRSLHELGALDVVVASHVVISGDAPHQVLTVSADDLTADEVEDALQVVGSAFDVAAVLSAGSYDGPPELRSGLEIAVGQHGARTHGRVVVFPGDHLLLGTVSAADVTLWSDIDRVEHLTGEAVDPRTPLVTRDFLRPRWQGGELVLHVQPAVGGTVVPFETPYPTPCCADHA
jgi:hypothetical protein